MADAKHSWFSRRADKKAQELESLTPFIPDEIVGGSVPYFPGIEREAVMNAAAQACATDRVHFTYTIAHGRCWYLATRSALLASAPDSWCPLALALPQEDVPQENNAIYVYSHGAMTAALQCDMDRHHLQVYLGKSRLMLPGLLKKGDPIYDVPTEDALPRPWINEQLRRDRASQGAARFLLNSGLATGALTVIIGSAVALSPVLMNPEVEQVRLKTIQATNKTLRDAQGQFANAAILHMHRIQELLDALVTVKGTLVRYEVKGGAAVEWEALVPYDFASGDNPIIGDVSVIGEIDDDGRVRIRGNK